MWGGYRDFTITPYIKIWSNDFCGYICSRRWTNDRFGFGSTELSKWGCVYDSGCPAGTLDVYVDW